MRVLAVLGLLALAGCAAPAGAPDPAADAEAPAPFSSRPDARAAESGFETHILRGGFEHPRLDAAPNATIVWRNVDDRVHRVVADDGAFDSGDLVPGEAYPRTFFASGDFPFGCRYHPEMRGLVVVR